jgi:cytochrome c553
MRVWIIAGVLAAAAAAAVPASAATLPERLAPCLACHGESGQSANKEVPSLGAQPKDFVLIQLFMFREKLRKVELMNEMVKGFSDDDLRAFSEAIAKLPAPKPAADPADPARIERAKALAAQHRCNVCHKQDFSGQDQVPHLADQREDYLLKALRDYKSNARAGYDATMAEVIQPITDENIVDLAHYLARVK